MSKVIISMILAITTIIILLVVGHSIGFWLAVFTFGQWALMISLTALFFLYYQSLFENFKLRNEVKELKQQINTETINNEKI